MDRQIVDLGLNIIIQRGDRDWRPVLRNEKKNMYIAAVQIVARLLIVILDDAVLSVKGLVQF